MAVCIFWLLTYVGQGLDMAVGNRPVIIVQGGQEQQDYRQHGGSLRKKSELSSNLLHLRIYPSEASQRDELSNWLLLNEEPRVSSWTPAGILIDDIMREPRELQTVFFALSPAVLNVLYSDYVASQSQQQQHHQQQQVANSELLYDDPNLIGQHQQRAKKLRIDCKHSRNTVSLPILVCDETGRRQQQPPLESRQSNYEENLFEQRLSGGAKTDLKRAAEATARDYQNAGGAGGNAARGFLGSKAFVYESGKAPAKRNHIAVGRRSIDLPHSPESGPHQPQIPTQQAGASIASQFMLRSTRGSIQYDVPQIECPVSEDGMERFACPTADRMGRYHCIDDHVLCDGFIDCPTGEDEDRQACMFYKTTKAHLDVLADAILRWARGR